MGTRKVLSILGACGVLTIVCYGTFPMQLFNLESGTAYAIKGAFHGTAHARKESSNEPINLFGQGNMSPAMIGGLVVGISLAAATLLCTGLCLALWYRRLRGEAGDPNPATFLVSKQKSDQYASSEHPMAFVMPTITASEAGSEPQTPTPTLILTPTERSKGITKAICPSINPPNPEDHPNVQRWDALAAASCTTPPPAYRPPSPNYNMRPRSASPKGLLKSTKSNPPLSLPLGCSNKRSAKATQRPRSASPKIPQVVPRTAPILPPRTFHGGVGGRAPPVLPPRSIFFRRTTSGEEELRDSVQSQMSYEQGRHSGSELPTPDSIDGWGPTWTPASSVASGGGCGLGELQVRLRYSMRTRLLRLTVLSADNLPLRLGPEPIDTYTKAVLLPDKRVRFSTRTIPAIHNAHFNASFTHAARPSRLSHCTLRFSVCQVTSCGRRVVLGYAALPLASTGLRSGLNHDLDTGSLTLSLQESAPDQQVGMGGQLQTGLSWDTDTNELTISILHLVGLQYDQNNFTQDVQVYIKVTVYTNNTILCWRRTTPRGIGSELTLFEEELVLRMPELDLDATHLVLSARERTGPGCGRRVLGSCVVGRGSCVGEDGRHHWLDMLKAAPDVVVRTHQLTAIAPFESTLVSQNPPPYQNVFPGGNLQDPDLPGYHKYQNIGFISCQNYPVVEIPGPTEIQTNSESLQNKSVEQDMPFSSDDCLSSDVLTPDQCYSPDLVTDELSSPNESHHSEQTSSDHSHYSEISSPDHCPTQEVSSRDQSSEALLSPVTVSDIEEQDQDINRESIYCNRPLSYQPNYDTPKVPSEPIYAKPDLTLKRNYLAKQAALEKYADSSTGSQHTYQSSEHPSEPIYENPEILDRTNFNRLNEPDKHIYDKPNISPQHMYENSNIIPKNIYQVPDLSVPRIYQRPSISPPHIYENPSISPEHIYQVPYDASLRRYQNISMIMDPSKHEYANINPSLVRPPSKRRYENIPGLHEEPSSIYHFAISPDESVRSDSENVSESVKSDSENVSIAESESKEKYDDKSLNENASEAGSEQRDSLQTYETESESSEIYHDARSSTLSSHNE